MTFQLTLSIKIEHPYVEPQFQNAETIEVETKKEEEDFNDLKIKFGQIDNAATQQKKQSEMIHLVDYFLDDDNSFNDTVEDIFIDNDLFDNNDNRDIKIADNILGGINITNGNYVRAATTSNYTWKYRFKHI